MSHDNQKEIFGEFTIHKDKYIGKGQFGMVYQATKKEQGVNIQICCKTLKIDRKDQSVMQLANREIAILKLLKTANNPNLIRIYDVIEQQEQIIIFMEYCQGGDLKGELELRSNDKKPYKMKEIIQFIKDMVSAYKALYTRDIIHRDIKPANILVDINGKYKLTDFGMGRVIADAKKRQPLTKVGTPAYAAPQLYMEDSFSSKCDIYSLGIIVYQLAYLDLPFKLHTLSDLMAFLKGIKLNKFRCNRERMNIIGDQKDKNALADLIESMMMYDEDSRISWDDLFNHQFMKPEVEIRQKNKVLSVKLSQNTASNLVPDSQIPDVLLQDSPVQDKKFSPQIFAAKSGIEGYQEAQRIIHILNLSIAKARICDQLLCSLREDLATLPQHNELHFNLLITCVFGYMNRLMVNAYGFTISNQKYISEEIKKIFEMKTLFAELQKIQWVGDLSTLKEQIEFKLRLSNKEFKAQEEILRKLSTNYNYAYDLTNFYSLVELRNRIEYRHYIHWFEFFYTHNYQQQLVYHKHNTYTHSYLKLLALIEIFISIESEYPLADYAIQSPLDMQKILTYNVEQLQAFLANRRNI